MPVPQRYFYGKASNLVSHGTILEVDFPNDGLTRSLAVQVRGSGLQVMNDNLELIMDYWDGSEEVWQLLTDPTGNVITPPYFVTMHNDPMSIKVRVIQTTVASYAAAIQIL